MSIVDRFLGSDEPATEPDDGPLETKLDDLFTALANPRRRFIIDNLADRDDDEWVSIRELARGLSLVEQDYAETFDDLRSDDTKKVYIALYQTHFPRLAEWGLLEHDRRSNNVRKTAGTVVAQRLLRVGYREVSGDGEWYA